MFKLPPEDMRDIDQAFWAKIEEERRFRAQYERQRQSEPGKK